MKVLGVGLSRTGTFSLSEALRCLGYRSVHFDVKFVDILKRANVTSKLDLSSYDSIDALTDTPACLFYSEFIERYSDLKIILTVRDEESWLRSIVSNYERLPVKSPTDRSQGWRWPETTWYGRTLSFGTHLPNRFLLRRGYRQHNRRVMTEVDPDGLLVMDIPGGDGWEKLCPFLGKEIPDAPFPWLNKS